MSFFGALPFVINGDIPSVVDAMFETVSGFTTTGSSILTDVEALARCSYSGGVLLTGYVVWVYSCLY